MEEKVVIDLMDDLKCSRFIHSELDGYRAFRHLAFLGPIAWLPMSSWNELWKQVGKHRRQLYNYCIKKGYYCELITPKNYCQDIYEINTSKQERQGMPMHGYDFSVEKLTQIYSQWNEPFCNYICSLHYHVWFGVFTKEKKLVGYVHLVRIGQFTFFRDFLGHGNYLKDGIMYYLHLYIQRLFRESDNEHFKGIKGTAYTYMSNGTKGLQFWKAHAGFSSYNAVFLNPNEPDLEKKKTWH